MKFTVRTAIRPSDVCDTQQPEDRMAKATAKRKPRGKTKPPAAAADELLEYYREMLLIRRFEEKAGQL